MIFFKTLLHFHKRWNIFDSVPLVKFLANGGKPKFFKEKER